MLGDTALAYILIAAAMAAYWRFAQTRPPVATVCPHCGDVVQMTRGWPTPCPTCGHCLLG